jgi:ABC-2 type transport system ATP-binding protein
MNIIEINNVNKSFKNIILFDNLTINFEKGKIYGIVGPNGSGKSVLFKMVCGFIYPDKGIIKVNGNLLNKENRFPTSFGILINKAGYLDDKNGFDNLKYLAMINNNIGDKEIRDWMIKFGLEPSLKTKVKDYSLGMKQKLGLCQAVMENQSVLILDEPFNALDKKSVQLVRQILLDLNKQGVTILMTSHIQEDINYLCEIIYEIDNQNLKIL